MVDLDLHSKKECRNPEVEKVTICFWECTDIDLVETELTIKNCDLTSEKPAQIWPKILLAYQ